MKPSQYQTKVAITEFKSSVEAPLSTSNPSLKQGWRSSTPLEINLCPISNYTTRLFQPYFKPGPKFQTLSQPTINHLEKTKKVAYFLELVPDHAVIQNACQNYL